MKQLIKNTWLLIIPLLVLGSLMTACEKDDEEMVMSGEPSISYVRVTDPAAADSLLVGAPLGDLIAIVGENLGSTKHLWFNDQKAALEPSYVTDRTILVNIPNKAPTEVTDVMTLVFANGDTLRYPFEVTIAPPLVLAMENEYAPIGTETTVTGDFFFEPVAITFTGGAEAEIIAMDQNAVTFIVPEGAQTGPVSFTTAFGTTISNFHYKDQRNIILNYDDLTAEGSWRPGPIASEDGIDGNYLKLGGVLAANERIEDNFESQFWGHTRYDVPTNLVEGYPEDLVLKFEARADDWYGSILNITWGPWDNAGNQEVWSNLNGRGLWRPWVEHDAPFDTEGEWITVTIPLTEMIYSHNQDADGNNIWEPDMKFDKDVTGTLSFWVIATPKADSTPFELHIDNVRIVEK
ncbi:glycan-binding surface protein [Nafulsella turpanensis]|uniref:glycan-binding surface protein n=1 Tax=Nafulsella turpanensis TaxID=1265690 RepID=UPI0003485F89|nr:glycan-binding surface protein [Nafulsella turpanensis]